MTQKPTKKHPIVALSSRIAYQNPWMRVREDTTLRANGTGIYGVVETNDSVAVCAVNDDNELYLIHGYNYPTGTWTWQIPGGGDDNENPVRAAKRELEEETGITAGHYELVGSLLVTRGLLRERRHVVVATGLRLGVRLMSDDNDSIGEGKFFSLSDVKRMIQTGDICDSLSVSEIYLMELWLENNVKEKS